MLSKASLGLVCLWFANSLVKGQEPQVNCTVDENELPEVQSGINNFIIEELGTVLFPYALNQCTGTNVITTGRWYWFQCGMDSSGMSTVTKTEYFTDDCSDVGAVMAVYNESDMVEGEVGHFECGGTDTSVRIRMGLDSDCQNSVVIYAALGACSNMASGSQLNFYCSADEAIAQIFTLDMQMTSTFLPSSTALLFNTTSLPTAINETFLPTGFNNTFLPTGFNSTLPTLFNLTTLPTGLNATMPTDFNATMPSMIVNISTSQIEMMLCQDEAFCDKWIFTRECSLLTALTSSFGQSVYGIFEECDTTGMAQSSTTMSAFNTTFDDNITVTEPTTGSSTSTTRGTETTSGAIRPSFMFTVGMFFSLFFLVSV